MGRLCLKKEKIKFVSFLRLDFVIKESLVNSLMIRAKIKDFRSLRKSKNRREMS